MQRFDDWPWYKFGFLGVAVMSLMTGAHVVAAIARFFVEPWTWAELLLLPVQVVAIGFACGATIGLLFPLRRWGMIGHAVIGAAAANVYLLGCFACFDVDSLRHPRLSAVAGVASLAAFSGGWFGALIAWEYRQELRKEEKGRHLPHH
jgi:hypothetical protein